MASTEVAADNEREERPDRGRRHRIRRLETMVHVTAKEVSLGQRNRGDVTA